MVKRINKLSKRFKFEFNRIGFNKILKPFFKYLGYDLLKASFYNSIPNESDYYLATKSGMVGLNFNAESQIELLNNVVNRYLPEMEKYQLHKNASDKYFYINHNFMAVDSHVYYSIIREFKPKKIIEIGSGNSTLLCIDAVEKNIEEGKVTEIVSIEPYPIDKLKNALKNKGLLIEKKVQEVELSMFEQLGENDILFIDSTHVLSQGSDVYYEFLEILPSSFWIKIN